MKDFNLSGYLKNNQLLKESVGEEPAQHDRALDLVDNAVLPILGDIRDYMTSKQNLNISKPSEAMRALLDISDYFEDTPELAKTISDMYEDGFAPEDIAAFFYTDHSDALEESVEDDDEYIDYFETPEKLPPAISDLVDKWAETSGYDKLDYPDAEAMKSEFEAMGWTFEYGLDGVPYGLRPMADTSAQGEDEDDYDWYTDK